MRAISLSSSAACFAQAHHRAVCVGKNLIDGSIASQVFEARSGRGSHHNQARAVLLSFGKDLNGGVAVDDTGFNAN